ncbi:hypothetical protein NPIL_360791 [Nephila pilipes]|uniref:Uncharacterized protein n=1 Tax=Nephila pilipes TaxID=299642 RepID=A0A8X6U7M9_NEPPI|nr:hypothetical protein NPIL_360791 [Nephila pilipes]
MRPHRKKYKMCQTKRPKEPSAESLTPEGKPLSLRPDPEEKQQPAFSPSKMASETQFIRLQTSLSKKDLFHFTHIPPISDQLLPSRCTPLKATQLATRLTLPPTRLAQSITQVASSSTVIRNLWRSALCMKLGPRVPLSAIDQRLQLGDEYPDQGDRLQFRKDLYLYVVSFHSFIHWGFFEVGRFRFCLQMPLD